MKKLLTVNFKIWISMAVVISVSIAALFLILRMKVEKTFTTSLSVDDKNVATLIVKNKGAYLIKEQDKISLLVNEHFIDSTIKRIEYDGEAHQYLMTLDAIDKYLLPNTTIEAKIIYDQHSVWDALLNPGV